MKEFYAILQKVTDLNEEVVKDEAHAIELYKKLRELEIEHEKITLDKIPQEEDDFYTISQDPEVIAVEGLSAQIAVNDKIKVTTGFSRQTILAAYKKYKL